MNIPDGIWHGNIQSARPMPTHLFRPQHAQVRIISISGKIVSVLHITRSKPDTYPVPKPDPRDTALEKDEFACFQYHNLILTSYCPGNVGAF